MPFFKQVGRLFCVALAVGDGDHGRTQHAIRQLIAFLQDIDHGVARLVGIDHGDGLVLVRVELIARRRVLDPHAAAFKSGQQLLLGQFHA